MSSLAVVGGFVVSGSAVAQDVIAPQAARKSTLPSLKFENKSSDLLAPINKKTQKVSKTRQASA